MKKNRFKNKKFILLILLLSGISGTFFFFPLQMGGRYTCVYHRLFEAENPIPGNNSATNTGTSVVESAGNHDHSESPFLHRYLHHYAILWWISLALFAFSVYGLQQNRNLNRMEKVGG